MFREISQNMLACWLDVLGIYWLTVEDRLSLLEQPGNKNGQSNP
jgi:hypothetical protein